MWRRRQAGMTVIHSGPPLVACFLCLSTRTTGRAPEFLNTLKQRTLEGCSIFGEMFASADEGDQNNMKSFIMMTLVAATLLIGLPVYGAQVSIGIRIGPPPPPPVVYAIPATPGPEYVWVDGYWYPVGNHWRRHRGFWTRAPYVGARWWAPRYERGEYFEGYWEGDRGRMEHNHHWDRDRERDYREKERHRKKDRDQDNDRQ